MTARAFLRSVGADFARFPPRLRGYRFLVRLDLVGWTSVGRTLVLDGRVDGGLLLGLEDLIIIDYAQAAASIEVMEIVKEGVVEGGGVSVIG